MKSLPVKIGRKIKSLLHHVPSPKRNKHKAPETLPFLVTTATWATPVFPSLYIASDVVSATHKSEYIKDSFIHGDTTDTDSSRDTVVASDQSTHSSIPTIPGDFSHIQDPSFHTTTMTTLPEDLTAGEPYQEPEPVETSQTLFTPSEPVLSSPPTAYVEPEVPDPFLIDDEEDPLSDNEEAGAAAAVSESQQTILPAHEISLSSEPTPTNFTVPPPNVNKDVPPPPFPTTESDEVEAPDLYFPGLILPAMFLPIPNVRRPFSSNHLTWWLPRTLLYYNCTRRIH